MQKKKVVVVRPNSQEEWLKARENGIGASEVAAVVGLSPWDSPFSLFLRKTHQIPPTEETQAMKLGKLLEPVVVKLWEESTGWKAVKASAKDIIYQDPERPWRICTPDRIAYEVGSDGKKKKVLLEIKTSSMDFDPDDLPTNYLCQVQYQMHITGVHVCYLCWLVCGRTYGHARVEYDKAFSEWMVGEVDKFWNENVLGGKEPDLISVTDFAMKGSDPGTTIEADEEAISHIMSAVELNAEIATAETALNAHKDAVKLYMGEAEALTVNGKPIATWKSGTRGRTFLLKNRNIEELQKGKDNVSE